MSYSDNDWRGYLDLKHSANTGYSLLRKGKLYLPNGIPAGGVIRKGTQMDAILATFDEDTLMHSVASLFLEHHGIIGQKWGVRNGPPYPLKDGATDFTLKKNVSIYRYSDREEKSLRRNTYASFTKNDVSQYAEDLVSGELGPKNVKEIYTMKLTAKGDIRIRNGRTMVQDMVNDIGSPKLKEYFDVLDKAGYFSATPDMETRYKIWHQNEETMTARRKLGSAIHKHIYKDRDAFSEKYRGMGFSAVIDPEDFVWNYEAPLIITNESAFQIDSISHKKV